MLIHGVLSLGALFMLLPMVWMLATSFKLPGEIAVWPPHLLPQQPTLANYSGLFEAAPFVPVLRQQRVHPVASHISCVVTSMIAGAVFAKYRFPGRGVLFMLVLATAIVPFEAYMIPLYIELVRIHWINTYQAIILPTLVMSFGIFLVRQHVASAIPDELMEAARVDGASESWTFRRVLVPLSGNAISAVGIFAFIQAWAAFIWPLLVANNQLLFNMELGLTRVPVPLQRRLRQADGRLDAEHRADADRVPAAAPADNREHGADRNQGVIGLEPYVPGADPRSGGGAKCARNAGFRQLALHRLRRQALVQQPRASISFCRSMPVAKPMLSSMNTRSSVTTLPEAPGA